MKFLSIKFSSLLYAAVQVVRPGQWVKNLLVMAGFFFALADKFQTVSFRGAFLRTMLAFMLFCMMSGAVYIMNDLHDVEADRAHPGKKNRPIASARLPGKVAVAEYFVLLFAALASSLFLGRLFAICLAAYFIMQTLYTYFLKDMVLMDVFVIAIGFVMRVFVGTVAAGVRASSWLLLCTFMVALFLILCKRRDEKMSLGEGAPTHRKVLAQYDAAFLSHLISVTSACTILCYALYTLAPETVSKFGTERLVLTVPFVAFGIFRYMYLVFNCGQGGRPERTLTRDIPTVVNMILYAATCVFVMFSAKGGTPGL